METLSRIWCVRKYTYTYTHPPYMPDSTSKFPTVTHWGLHNWMVAWRTACEQTLFTAWINTDSTTLAVTTNHSWTRSDMQYLFGPHDPMQYLFGPHDPDCMMDKLSCYITLLVGS